MISKMSELKNTETAVSKFDDKLHKLIKRAKKQRGMLWPLPFDLLAFVTTIGQRYSMTQNEIMRLVMQEAEALGVNYRIGSAGR